MSYLPVLYKCKYITNDCDLQLRVRVTRGICCCIQERRVGAPRVAVEAKARGALFRLSDEWRRDARRTPAHSFEYEYIGVGVPQ